MHKNDSDYISRMLLKQPRIKLKNAHNSNSTKTFVPAPPACHTETPTCHTETPACHTEPPRATPNPRVPHRNPRVPHRNPRVPHRNPRVPHRNPACHTVTPACHTETPACHTVTPAKAGASGVCAQQNPLPPLRGRVGVGERDGGRRGIRTPVAVRRQVYSLVRLSAPPSCQCYAF